VPSCLQLRANCLFEDIYFADWESHIEGDPIAHARFEWGKVHAELDGDSMKDAIVVPVPYSANVSGLGYSRQSGCSYVEAIKKKKKGRTFIENPVERAKRAETSYELNDFLKEGQKLVIVDDSVVKSDVQSCVELYKIKSDAECFPRVLRAVSSGGNKICFCFLS
jgi:glutamine phosphoribosylpyrophosphate amidotransferase